MEVKFGTTNKRKNSTFIPTVNGDLGDCILKSPSSVIEPSFDVYTDDWPDYNYCYVPLFHRYYFITDIVSQYNGVWSISCVVDVLATYKTGILNTTAFVERAASSFNPSIPDSEIAMCTQFDVIESGQYYMPQMSNENGFYVLTVAGGSTEGFVMNWGLSKEHFGNFASSFFSGAKMEELSKYASNPVELITNCLWVPFDLASVSYGRGQIFAGQVDMGTQGRALSNVVHGTLDIPLKTPYKTTWKDSEGVTHNDYSDYRNTSPYITTELCLPGIGLVNIDTVGLMSDPSQPMHIMIDYYIAPATGDIEYLIKDRNGNGQLIMTVSGNCAVQIPVAGAVQNVFAKQQATFSQLMSGLTFAAGAGLTVGGLPAVGLGMMVGGAQGMASGMLKQNAANQRVINVSGSLGGWAGQFLNDGVRVIQRQYKLSGSALAIGRPLFSTARLGSFSGYVKCNGAYVGVPATDDEHNALMALINGGFYVE